MRDEAEVLTRLSDFAHKDETVRAVLFNGSRVNPNVKKDHYCDYDIVFIVHDPSGFVHDQQWIGYFGDLVMMQQNTIQSGSGEWYIFLMQFADGVRIDLSFRKPDDLASCLEDSLTKVLLDKDGIVGFVEAPNDASYVTKKPAQADFEDTMNEIWWCQTNVAKGILRKELPYAAYMLDVVIRPCVVKVLAWYVGMHHDWRVNTGKAGRWLERYLPDAVWSSFVKTYAGADYDRMRDALFETGKLTRTVGMEIAAALGYEYPLQDDRRMTAYLQNVMEENGADYV